MALEQEFGQRDLARSIVRENIGVVITLLMRNCGIALFDVFVNGVTLYPCNMYVPLGGGSSTFDPPPKVSIVLHGGSGVSRE